MRFQAWAGGALLVLAAQPGWSQEAVSAASGVFTDAQAQRGKQAYTANCATCHGTQLIPSNEDYPGLVGPPFEYSWHGKTLAERFERISTTMPYNAPGSLTPEQYADILAYVLSFNGYPAGEVELAHDTDILAMIVIEPLP